MGYTNRYNRSDYELTKDTPNHVIEDEALSLFCEYFRENNHVMQGLYSIPSYENRNPHCKAKTVWQPSQVYNGIPYTNKKVSS